ncbi:GNAT family N-acetyltransferase [Microbacterium capsulatum]|uniref:GNAT family N-acetyltransferase n=1 Tax=Microbacterium capsulatum TaxID=3041921 RepID=A0ABU0XD08_9MICO|nr:GNAT family N-acetyltransferase [Microbacterium sp. ASV81]MDQ4212999.1 GNAT family N-acetyltransferase [Microbacterium sp. ASV81]
MSALLAAYDAQLRGERELRGAQDVRWIGPVVVGVFPGGSGFAGYRDLGGADEPRIRSLVQDVRAHFEALPHVRDAEWKTRGHDVAPGLAAALRDAGFEPDEEESVMLGDAAALSADVPLPDGVRLREIRSESDIRAMASLQGAVFDDPDWRIRAQRIVTRLAAGEDVVLWIAEADGRVIGTGRLEPVAGTEFAGIWGGATLPEWRGRGVYRALTAKRAQAALARGHRYLHSDSTEFSRPILERSGMRKATTTIPYVWSREG